MTVEIISERNKQYPLSHCKKYKLPTYKMKTNAEFNKASSSESKGDQSCLLNVIVIVKFVELWQFES